MTANKIRGEVAIQLGEREVILVPSFAAMVKIEDRLGMGLGSMLGKLGQREIGAKDIRVFLEEAAKPALKEAEIATLVQDHGMAPFAAGIVTFLVNAVTGGISAEERQRAAEEAEKNARAAAPESPTTAASLSGNI